jgi:hypothetical protein
MKSLFLFITVFVMSLNCNYGQLVNLNPDPNGAPWITGGVPVTTPEIQGQIDQIPCMVRQSFQNPP